jgi:hypothetical protein
VEDQEPHRSRRLLGLSLVNLEPPPLQRRLDQQGSFKVTRPWENVPEPSSREKHSYPKELTISNLRVEALGPYNPLITDLLVPIMVLVVPPRVTHQEHQIVLQAVMEENVATSSGIPHTPSTAATT